MKKYSNLENEFLCKKVTVILSKQIFRKEIRMEFQSYFDILTYSNLNNDFSYYLGYYSNFDYKYCCKVGDLE